jgi:hypothetical protein
MRTPLLHRRGADVEEVEGAMAEGMGERRFKTARHKTQDARRKTQDAREEEEVRGGFWIADFRF